MKAPKFEKER